MLRFLPVALLVKIHARQVAGTVLTEAALDDGIWWCWLLLGTEGFQWRREGGGGRGVQAFDMQHEDLAGRCLEFAVTTELVPLADPLLGATVVPFFLSRDGFVDIFRGGKCDDEIGRGSR